MRMRDLFGMATESLLRRRARTVLTLTGVVLGACLLILSLAVGHGLRVAIEQQFDKGGALLHVGVSAKYGELEDQIPDDEKRVDGDMSDERRDRLKSELLERGAWQRARPKLPLTFDRLDELAELSHVGAVWPDLVWHNRMTYDEKILEGATVCVPSDRPEIEALVVAGRNLKPTDKNAVLVHEFHAWEWGYQNEADVTGIVGKKIVLQNRQRKHNIATFLGHLGGGDKLTPDQRKVLEQTVERLPALIDTLELPAEMKALLKKSFSPTKAAEEHGELIDIREEFEIVGVYRTPEKDDSSMPLQYWRFRGSSLLISTDVGQRLLSRIPVYRDFGVHHAVLQVDRKENVRAVVDQLDEMGFQHHSMVEFVERLLHHITLIIAALTGSAVAALVVAGIGITNTMVMSVLERIREIGVLKAVGATNGQILGMFLIEGLLLGLAGGLLGLACGWGISQALDAWVRSMLEREFHNTVDSAMFVFPAWVSFGVPLFCALLTMLASVYPAKRAAAIDPVHALRHD